MQIPKTLITSLETAKGFNKEAFEKVHSSGEQITSIRINPLKIAAYPKALSIEEGLDKVLWSEYGYYLDQRPSFTFDPLFHAGTYYVQEASSMFLEQALKQTVDLSKQIKVLDLCAAPGGKSTHIQSLISKDSLLVSNEVIRSRANVLKDNIIKWGCENVVITNNDPKDFTKLENYFDVIVVDAPCSGSGLFRRDPDAIEEWSENNVALCSQRQQRILADVMPALKNEGILIYSTCSYSKEEDEDIVDWMVNNLLVAHCPLLIDSNWGVIESAGGYRFWPDKVKGEGFFISCFKKNSSEDELSIKVRKKPEPVTKKELLLVEPWVNMGQQTFIKHLNTVYAWAEKLTDDFSFLLEQLHVIYSGVIVGELMRDKLVPDHALAMSKIIRNDINRVFVTKDQAIQYLQRKDVQLDTAIKGWSLIEYEGQVLGWANILSNRVNNYYPKSLRILKEL
jgi:16S rRNA C967 or C1407 C5-methylase (RsmB/RsmF family)/NOL1/NOP2/fmu family ribosome biogenesis protein